MDFWSVALPGLSAGAVYGLLAVGLVAVYTATRVINFFQGLLAALAVYVFVALDGSGVSVALAVTITIVLIALVSGGAQALVVARAEKHGELNAVLATVALMVIGAAAIRLIWGPRAPVFHEFLPSDSFEFAGSRVNTMHVIVVAVALAAAGLFAALMRYTSLGLRIRGAADNPVASQLGGSRPGVIAFSVWIASGALAAISGLLVGHLLSPSPEMAMGVLIKGFTAAAIGGFASPGLALTGALALGGIEGFVAYYLGTAVQDAVPLIVLLALLIVRPSGLARAKVVRAA